MWLPLSVSVVLSAVMFVVWRNQSAAVVAKIRRNADRRG
jgi:hypothetical protein